MILSPSLTLTRTAEDYGALALSCLRPPPAQDLWEWCSQHLMLYNGQRWNPRTAGLMRHWYRVANARLSLKPDPRDPYAHRCEQIWLAIAAQIAKSTFGRSVLLGAMANYPRIAALFLNRKGDLDITRERKLKREVLACPQIERMLPRGIEARERALGSLSWAIGATLLYFRSAAIADDTRAEAFELVDCDEIETYPLDVEGYGDPIDQIIARQRTLRRTRLCLGHSTPASVSGHTHRRVCSGSHERPLVDCPHCQGAQNLDPRQVRLAGDRKMIEVAATEILTQGLGRFACIHCGTLIGARDLHAAIRAMIDADRPWCAGEWQQDTNHPNGRWLCHADLDVHGRLKAIPPPESIIRSGQASALYSLDETLDTFAAKMALAEQGTESQRKTFVNNERAEPYHLIVAEVDADDITRAAQPANPYQFGSVNRSGKDGKGWLILHSDQQGNTRELYWYPWALRWVEPGGDSWLVDAGVAKSDDQADDLERRVWTIGETKRSPDRVTRDSANGNYKFDAYLWASRNPQKRILLRGDPRLRDGVPWEKVVAKPNERNRTPLPSGVTEYRIAPHFWRDRFWDSLRGVRPPRAWLPQDAPQFYLSSLTSEEQVVERRRVAGGWRDMVVWRPRVVSSTADKHIVREDNHWWDADVSIAAAINIFGWDVTPTDVPSTPVTDRPQGQTFGSGMGAW